MFCTNCGKQIDDNAKFCSACGTKTKEKPAEVSRVEEKTAEASRAEETPAAAPKVEKKPAAASRKEKKPAAKSRKAQTQRKLKRLGTLQIILSVLAVVAVAAAVLLIIFANKEDADAEDSGYSQSDETDAPQDDAPAEEDTVPEATPGEEDAVPEATPGEETPVDLRSQLYGTWGVYYGDILQTISICSDGTMYIWDGSNGQWLDYSWNGDTSICYDNLEYVYVDGQLVLIQDGQQTTYVYQRCPALAGNPITGAASYEELYKMLTEGYMFTPEHVSCMPNISRGAVCSGILWNRYGISGQEAGVEFLKMISQPPEDLANQMNDYYFEEGGISPIKFVITDLTPREDMIQKFQEDLENYDAENSQFHEQYIWELAQAEMCWVASGKVVYATGDSMPLSMDTETEGPLYILLMGGRYYWLWSELG